MLYVLLDLVFKISVKTDISMDHHTQTRLMVRCVVLNSTSSRKYVLNSINSDNNTNGWHVSLLDHKKIPQIRTLLTITGPFLLQNISLDFENTIV